MLPPTAGSWPGDPKNTAKRDSVTSPVGMHLTAGLRRMEPLGDTCLVRISCGFVLLESCDHLLTAWSRLICWLCRRSTGFYYAGHTSCLPTVTKWAEGRGAAHAPQIQPLQGMAAVLGASHFPPAVNLRGWVDRAHFPAVCLAPPSQLCSNECWCPQ